MNATSVTFTADFGGLAAAYFPTGNRFQIALSPSAALNGVSLGSVTGVSNLAQGDLSLAGNVITIDASNVSFQSPGGSFTVNFSTAVPGPSALLAIAGAWALHGRRRH